MPFRKQKAVKFEDLRVKNFDENGLFDPKELKKVQMLFFQQHDIQVVSEDVGRGILHGDNERSYDLSPISSSQGFLHWAKKTFQELLGPFSFLTEGLGYIVVLFLALCLLSAYSKLKKLVMPATETES